MAESGWIQNREHFKKLGDNLYEFKRHQIRLLGDYRPGRRFLVALGVRKKKDEHYPKDLRAAAKILEAHDLREREESQK
jgi:hypothetical protein